MHFRIGSKGECSMPLWIFETDTILQMCRDAQRVSKGVSKDAHEPAREMVALLVAELNARGVPFSI